MTGVCRQMASHLLLAKKEKNGLFDIFHIRKENHIQYDTCLCMDQKKSMSKLKYFRSVKFHIGNILFRKIFFISVAMKNRNSFVLFRFIQYYHMFLI